MDHRPSIRGSFADHFTISPLIRLTVFGQRDLVDENSQPILAVLRQPKSFAVLVYLALAGLDGVRSRDSVLAMFWPDSTESNARHSLAQVLLTLRRDLGPDVIVSRSRGEVGVRGGSLWCDAVEFDRARQGREAAAMLDLYTGDLLPGFYVPRAAELEHWMGQERERYRREAITAAWQLSESAETRGEFRVAADWAAAAARTSLYDEAAIQRQLTLLGRIHDRAGAIHAYDAFRRRLADELELEPSPETKRLIAQIRSLPGSPAQPVDGKLEAASGDRELALSTAHAVPTYTTGIHAPGMRNHRPDGRRRVRRSLAAAIMAAALAGIVAWGARNRTTPSADAVVGDEISVDVQRFAPLDSASASIGRALTASTINQLSQVNSFSVRGPEAANARHPRIALDRALHPQLVVAADVGRSHGRIHVALRIVDAVSRRTVRSVVLDHDSSGREATIELLSRQISSIVRKSVGHEIRLAERSAVLRDKSLYALMQQADENLDLADQFERSGKFLDAANVLKSVDTLLVSVEARTGSWPEPMIERASVFERLGALYMAPPLRDTAVMRRFFANGIAEANRAVEAAPQDPAGMESLGSLDYWYWLAVQLPADSAKRLLATSLNELRGAVRLDPGRAEAWSLLGASYQSRADYAAAYVAENHAWRADAYLRNPQEILANLSVAAYEMRDDSAAQYWCAELNRQFEGSWSGAYCELELLAENGAKGARSSVISHMWDIVDDTAWSAAPQQRIEPHFQMLAAAILARYGMLDSAESVIARAKTANAKDSELVPLEAYARLLLHEDSTATALMTRYVATDPLGRAGVARSRRFAGLPNLQQRLMLTNIPTAIR